MKLPVFTLKVNDKATSFVEKMIRKNRHEKRWKQFDRVNKIIWLINGLMLMIILFNLITKVLC